MAGIVGYGTHIPRQRIKVEEIAKVWGADAPSYKKGLMLREKSVPPPDMDTITLSVEAARRALIRAQNVDPKDIGAIYIGSESHPYAVKPSGTTVSEAIGATPDIHCVDFEFACKAGSEAMFVAMSHIDAGKMKYALAIGGDTSQGAPSDALEFSAAAGAAAFIMGNDNLVAECLYTHSYTTDMPDFWRREHEFYPQHGGRFTGEEAYFVHTKGATNAILEKSGMKPQDFKYAVFHQPNGKFPQRVALQMGFTQEQIDPGWLSPRLGNTYSGASPIGLTSTLDVAEPGDLILMCSYGSGAGSDSFIWKVTDRIKEVQDLTVKTATLLDENKVYIDYGTYAKYRHKIRKNA
ncbi:MAG: hydroxymethylglutaryl-CoA synthase [candidate division Zixibacteria bacterium]|nr:hydroxymethylglutaryl-CoA synthase [candidate division Zixibacteria bacterium]